MKDESVCTAWHEQAAFLLRTAPCCDAGNLVRNRIIPTICEVVHLFKFVYQAENELTKQLQNVMSSDLNSSDIAFGKCKYKSVLSHLIRFL